jgi:hypothetical protein
LETENVVTRRAQIGDVRRTVLKVHPLTIHEAQPEIRVEQSDPFTHAIEHEPHHCAGGFAVPVR